MADIQNVALGSSVCSGPWASAGSLQRLLRRLADDLRDLGERWAMRSVASIIFGTQVASSAPRSAGQGAQQPIPCKSWCTPRPDDHRPPGMAARKTVRSDPPCRLGPGLAGSLWRNTTGLRHRPVPCQGPPTRHGPPPSRSCGHLVCPSCQPPPAPPKSPISALTPLSPSAIPRLASGDELQGAAADCNSAGETHAWFDSRVAHHPFLC